MLQAAWGIRKRQRAKRQASKARKLGRLRSQEENAAPAQPDPTRRHSFVIGDKKVDDFVARQTAKLGTGTYGNIYSTVMDDDDGRTKVVIKVPVNVYSDEGLCS